MTTTPHSDDWSHCPPGEIAGLVNSLKKHHRRKTLQQAAVVTSAIVLLVLVAGSVLTGFFQGQTPLQAIACEKVLQLTPQYVHRELDAELTSRIDRHLTKCPRCREHIHADYPQFPLPGGRAGANACSAANLPLALVQFR